MKYELIRLNSQSKKKTMSTFFVFFVNVLLSDWPIYFKEKIVLHVVAAKYIQNESFQNFIHSETGNHKR